MPSIHVLDEPTINQIAAGEVVERPSAVIKELIENAVDAGATAVTAEIKEGGLSFIRITDNGAGIAKEDIPFAFLRHATSKISTAEDLLSVTSLGFRGEALSSIAAVSQVELITKTPSALNGYRYIIEGGEEKSLEEIGCPGGTTVIVRNIFYNTPARRKFLKSAMTEASYANDLMERLIISHPDISFKFIVNNQVKLQSSGNNNSRDILYHVYGRDISRELLPVDYTSEEVTVSGFIGKPLITRGNRNYENYFINGRFIKSNVITKAIEEAYKPFLMQHKYPFTSLYLTINPNQIDVNVHPQKMEIRLKSGEEIYRSIFHAIRDTLSGKELIPKVILNPQEEVKENQEQLPEPFEENRRKNISHPGQPGQGASYGQQGQQGQSTSHGQQGYQTLRQDSSPEKSLKFLSELSKAIDQAPFDIQKNEDSLQSDSANKMNANATNENELNANKSDVNGINRMNWQGNPDGGSDITSEQKALESEYYIKETDNNYAAYLKEDSDDSQVREGNAVVSSGGQINLFAGQEAEGLAPFLSKQAFVEHRIIGQVFSTYWLVEYKKELFIIDQHAAHEKVLYERLMAAAKEKTFASQLLLPPIILTLSLREQEVLVKYEDTLKSLGYEFEPFGGREYSFRAVPANLYGLSEKDLLIEFIDELTEDFTGNAPTPNSVLERVATMSCKAAVKANHNFSYEEAAALIKELLTLENPYHCPHGRPVIISISQYELEKKFKRIV